MSIPAYSRSWLRWTARLTGGASLAYCARHALGGTLGESAVAENRMLAALLIFAVVAYLVAWWREIEGGTALATIAVALGGVAFTEAEQGPFVASLVVSLPLFLAGGLFCLAGGYALRTTIVRH